MKTFGICLFGLAVSLAAPSTRAELVDLGHVTRDTASGLEWLDLSHTNGRSFDEVVSQFAPGGLFEGYRHATAAEAQALLAQVGLPIVPYTAFPAYGGLDGALASFDSLLGLNFGGLGKAFGFSAQVGGSIPGYGGYHALFYGFPGSLNTDLPPVEIAGAFGDWLVSTREVTVGHASSYKSSSSGHFLVAQVTAVPEPATMTSMLAGLLLTSVAVHRRRRPHAPLLTA